MEFCWCTITVSDIEKSIGFYDGVVGLPVARRFSTADGTEIAFLGGGETKIELICPRGGRAVGAPQGISLGFKVPGLQKAMEFVKEKGVEIASGPFSPSPGVSFFFVRDPDGVNIQFVESA